MLDTATARLRLMSQRADGRLLALVEKSAMRWSQCRMSCLDDCPASVGHYQHPQSFPQHTVLAMDPTAAECQASLIPISLAFLPASSPTGPAVGSREHGNQGPTLLRIHYSLSELEQKESLVDQTMFYQRFFLFKPG